MGNLHRIGAAVVGGFVFGLAGLSAATDRKAAEILGARMPKRPSTPTAEDE